MTDPFLAEVTLRAWGTDDPRVLDPLRHENQPAQTFRAEAVGERARKAGWPDENIARSRKTATAATRRLEGMDWHHRAQSRRSYQRQAVVAAYKSRRSRGAVTTTRGAVLPVEEEDTGAYNHDDGPGTIFDE